MYEIRVIRGYNHFIMAIASINPTTGETLKIFTPLTPAQIEEARQRAQGITDQGLFDLIFDKETAST